MWFGVSLLDKRIASCGGNAAHVFVIASHANVALLAPRGAPRVLDEPVVDGRVGAIADDEHTVIERLALVRARRIDEYALLVEHEVVLGDVDGHRDGTHGGDRLLQRLLVARLDVNEARACGTDGLLVEVAFLVVSVIRIRRLRV